MLAEFFPSMVYMQPVLNFIDELRLIVQKVSLWHVQIMNTLIRPEMLFD